MINYRKFFGEIPELHLSHFRMRTMEMLQGLAAVHNRLHFNQRLR